MIFDDDGELVPCGACGGRGVLGFDENGDAETCDDCYGSGVLSIDFEVLGDEPEIGGEG